jgi:DegV family protein with EDD domain
MIRIITDTSTLLKVEDGKRLNIEVLPLCINIGDLEKRDTMLDMDELYDKISKGTIVTSSQPPIGEVMDIYEKYPEDEIINITLAAGLSGTYGSAVGAKVSVDNNDNITVFNSKTLCGNQRYMVEKAVSMRDEGKSFKEIIECLEDLRNNQGTFIIPQNFEYLKRSGRLTSMAATVATVLNLRTILTQTEDGCKLDKFATKRSFKLAVKCILEQLENINIGENYIIYVSHARALNDANKIISLLKEKFPNTEIRLLEFEAAFVTHAGPECVAIQYIKK